MSTLTIRASGRPGTDPLQISRDMGGSITFGVCACAGCTLDLRLAPECSVNFRGEILVGADRWRIVNLSATEPILVRHVDAEAPPLTALPGESLSFRYDMALLEPHQVADGMSLTLFFDQEDPPPPPVGATCPAIKERLDPELALDARYFAVLAALCEPTLAPGRSREVPTSSRIAARLALTARAVDAHIDYLVSKFDIPVPNMRSAGWKRRALIEYVQRHDAIARAVCNSFRIDPAASTS
jgi:hypothetical protein